VGLGHQILILSLYLLCTARVTRLINADMILDRLRLYPIHKMRAAQDAAKESYLHGQTAAGDISQGAVRRWSTVNYFIACPWCVGMWVALALGYPAIRLCGWPWWSTLPVALAASHLVGVLAFAADTEDTEVVEDDH
jgi:hypothetical protein